MRAYLAVVVEPDRKQSGVIAGWLKLAGYKVIQVDSIESAGPLLESVDADLVISDAGDSPISHEALYERIQAIRRNAGVAFIFVCPNEACEKALKSAERPRCDYARAPVKAADLLRRAAGVLKRAQNEWTRQESCEGDAETLPLADLLQNLGFNGRTCVVEVTGKDDIGTIYLRQGQIVQAEAGGKDGMEALKAMLAWQGARYIVTFQPVQEKSVFNLSTEAILVEAKAALLGEGQKEAWAAPWQKGAKTPAQPVPAATPAPAPAQAARRPETPVAAPAVRPGPLRELIKESIIKRNYRQALADLDNLIKLEGQDKNLKDARQLLQMQIQKYL